MQVYYESLCPYSIAFITKQLYPVYVELKGSIELELIPWGHATVSTYSYYFTKSKLD